MKKIIMILLIVMATLPLVMAADTTLKASMQKYEPIPAEPGQYVTVYIKVENNDNEDAPNAAIEIVDQFPFKAVDGQEDIGRLGSRQSYVADFRVRVDSGAVVGNNNLKVKYTTDVNSASWQEKSFAIEVKPTDASISIIDVKVDPEEITPGGDAEITITVKNEANIVLRDVSVQPTLFTQTGSTIVDLPFIPKDSVMEKKLGVLDPAKTKDAVYNIKAYPTATPGYYKIPITVTFFDEAGNEQTQSDAFGVVIKAKPELDVILDKTTLKSANTDGVVSIKFVNKGINDLKFLDVKILESEEYEVVSTPAQYIGDLDSDDYRTEDFTINTAKEDVNLKIQVDYKDENNKEYENILELPARYVHVNDQQSKGLSGTTIFLIIVIIILITYIVISKRRNKKKR